MSFSLSIKAAIKGAVEGAAQEAAFVDDRPEALRKAICRAAGARCKAAKPFVYFAAGASAGG